MRPPKSRIVSAQVILRSAEGKSPDRSAMITSSTLGEVIPAKEEVKKTLAAFQRAGFTTGPMIGMSFSIAGSVEIFERMFRVRLRDRKQGGLEAVAESGSVTVDLPLDNLPASINEIVTAVTFPLPPEFGPGAP